MTNSKGAKTIVIGAGVVGVNIALALAEQGETVRCATIADQIVSFLIIVWLLVLFCVARMFLCLTAVVFSLPADRHAMHREGFCNGYEIVFATSAESLSSLPRAIQHPVNPLLTKWSRETTSLYSTVDNANFRVGEFVIARTEERENALRKECASAQVNGFPDVRMVTPQEAKTILPLLNDLSFRAALFWPGSTGVCRVATLAIIEELAGRARRKGVRFQGYSSVQSIAVDTTDGSVRGVQIIGKDFGLRMNVSRGVKSSPLQEVLFLPCQKLVVAAGAWSTALLTTCGVRIPAVNVQHLWALSQPLPSLSKYNRATAGGGSISPGFRHPYQASHTSLPGVFDADASIYIHQFGDRLGVGSYAHRALLVDSENITSHSNAELPFTPEHFHTSAKAAQELFPCLESPGLMNGGIEWAMNGLMTFAPDGYPLVGAISSRPNLFIAVGVWVMHSRGVGRYMAGLITTGEPPVDQQAIDGAQHISPSRFDRSLTAHTPEARNNIKNAYEKRCSMAKL